MFTVNVEILQRRVYEVSDALTAEEAELFVRENFEIFPYDHVDDELNDVSVEE